MIAAYAWFATHRANSLLSTVGNLKPSGDAISSSALGHLQSLTLATIKSALPWGSDNLRATIIFSRVPNLVILVLATLFGSELNSVSLKVLQATTFRHLLDWGQMWNSILHLEIINLLQMSNATFGAAALVASR